MRNLYAIVIVGVGGTGSFVACDLARYLGSAAPAIQRYVSLVLVDGDRVEDKNRARQMYYPEDVGQNKALCLAQAINDTFNLGILASDRYIDCTNDIAALVSAAQSQITSRPGTSGCTVVPVIISCVDNVAARLQMESYFAEQKTCIYIDSGNGYSNGQCIYAVKDDGVVLSPGRDFYGFQYDVEEEQKARSEMSCEELNSVAPQHILANRYASLHILSAVFQLLEGQEIVRGITTFDAFKGTSTHNLPEAFGFEAKTNAKESKKKKKKN